MTQKPHNDNCFPANHFGSTGFPPLIIDLTHTICLHLLSVAVAIASALNINTASPTEAQLETLFRTGATTAYAIVVYREQRGPLKTVADLALVKGIGNKTVQQLRDSITAETE